MIYVRIESDGHEYWPVITTDDGLTLLDEGSGTFATEELARARAIEFLATVPGGDKAVWSPGGPMTRDQWKARTTPLLVALMALEDKAQDSGLTEREKAVHDVLEARYEEVVAKLLRGKV